MIVGLLALALQLQVTTRLPAQASPPPPRVAADDDSLRDVGRAHDAQAGFERGRRYVLPWATGSGGYCDVRVGRFCWWYEDGRTPPPEEPAEVRERRTELLAELDAAGHRRPGDRWIAGMRTYYHIENREPALADSAARECAAVAWWCGALRAWAAQARGDVVAADSGFAAALDAMPDSTRCAWRDITVLLPGDTRERYARRGCADRAATEARYWLLARPRLATPANEWRVEFYARRVVGELLADAATPHRLQWGDDTRELLLRYGWPVSWSRIVPVGPSTIEPAILGHDPAPSFHYGPAESLLERDVDAPAIGWTPSDLHATSRFAHPAIRRIAEARATLSRFRRGDSTLVAAVWETSDDSLARPTVTLGALDTAGRTRAAAADSARRGHAVLMVAGRPRVAGVELADSASGSFAFVRAAWAPHADSTAIVLSDLLLFTPEGEGTPPLDVALSRALASGATTLDQPIGLYWESYGPDSAGAEVETSVFVERIDQGVFRGIRQRIGLSDPDSPVIVRWNESRPSAGGVAPRALSLDLSRLPAGRYRITVGVTPALGAGASAAREVELRAPD